MKIGINGAGVAGPTLAWWLNHYGHEPVLFERAPTLRTGGYMIDFWGLGYDIAEQMGLLPTLHEKGYYIESLELVNSQGQKIAGLNTGSLSTMLKGRFLSIARSELAATIFHACHSIDTRFNCSIETIETVQDGLITHLCDGSTEKFDLVVGADGLHSHIRSITFGPEDQFKQNLGAYVCAFTLSDYQPRNELTYISYPSPLKQIARVALRENRTLFLFTFSAKLIAEPPKDINKQKALLRSLFENAGWEAASILERLDETSDFYFDCVSQVKMDHWTKDRVALIGDAAACASLLAGEGTGLGMTEAYVLAGELHQANGNYREAFKRYEQRLQPFLKQKQQAALRSISFFVPKNKLSMFLVKSALKASSINFLSQYFIGRLAKDDLELPNYKY